MHSPSVSARTTAYAPTAASTWPNCGAECGAHALDRYAHALASSHVATFAGNFAGTPGSVRTAHATYPLLRGSPRGGLAYPVALRTQYVHYARDELTLLATARERVLGRCGIALAATLLDAAEAERTTQWNAWLLSTNPLPPTIADDVDAVTGALARAYPEDALWLRSVDPLMDHRLLPRLRAAGYVLVASRRVYHFDGTTAEFMQRNTTRRDAKLLRDGRFEVVPHAAFTLQDIARVPHLYHAVYVAKHSRCNPNYTPTFFERAWRERWFDFTGLRDPRGRLVAMMGLLRVGDRTSTPFLGYDTSAPETDALYRRLVALLLERTAHDRDRLDFSSGAAEFKRRRGGIAATEYNALYVAHLPARRRAAWHALAELSSRVGEDMLVRAQP